jgi:hypothetical protein
MAKFYGAIGFGVTQETTPGVHREQITERTYFGEVLSNSRTLESSDQVNDNIGISNRISIIADPYANENFHAMRYVHFMGARWKVRTADASSYPRIVLTLGGVYNGAQT